MSHCCTPTKWKDTKLIFIPKPGKSAYNQAKAYRPISLSNYLLKTLERLAGWKMKIAIKDNPVHSRQHGFRTDRSTETAISDAANYIEKNILKRKFCIGVLLDIQAAFDSIKPHKIKAALLKHGGDKDMVNWYYNYLIHRNLYTCVSGTSLCFRTSTGFPQGGVNSADFWIIVFNPALEIINKNSVRGDGFADDLLVMRGGYSLKTAVKDLQTTLDELILWGKEYGLKFNPKKTIAVIFHRRKINPDRMPSQLRMNGIQIPFSTEMKYLGVIMDNKLNWTTHFNQVMKTCKTTLLHTSNIIRKKWGPKTMLSKWLFTGIIRPKITYASLVWGHTMTQKTKINKLRKLNRLAAITITPVRQSTPTLGLEVIYDLLPLHLFISKTALASKDRLKEVLDLDWEGTNKSGKAKGHLKYWGDLQEKMSLKDSVTDSCREYIYKKDYKINTDSYHSDSSKHLCKSQITVYTDGSRTDTGVGCGFVIYYKGKNTYEEMDTLNKECTVYQAEL